MAHADLSVNFFGTDGSGDTGYNGQIIFRTELVPQVDDRAVGRLADVRSSTNSPTTSIRPCATLALIDADEQHRILDAWSRGDQPPPGRPRTIPELLEPSRQWGPDRIAVRCGSDEIDYPSLHRRSDNLAALLADRGVGPGSLVGLSTRRSIDLVVALVAIMKAGAAYFPIDPGYPAARKQFMLDDVEPQVVVATAEAVDTMPQDTRGPAALAG